MSFRILLVDDSEEFLEAAERFLASEPDLEIVGKARSGEEALALIETTQPDLVLMDVAMPGMNGLEATRRIKGQTKAPKVVMLTLYDNPEYRMVAAENGADGFVTKSEFTVHLRPLIRPWMAEKGPAGAEGGAKMRHILIVDDSPTMRRMVRASVQRLPAVAVTEAGNGLEAIERLALKPVDLMVLDLNMPDMHGLEVLRFLRSHERYRGLPVVVLTTKADPATRQAALAAGASLYLTKPFEPRELSERVGELLRGEK